MTSDTVYSHAQAGGAGAADALPSTVAKLDLSSTNALDIRQPTSSHSPSTAAQAISNPPLSQKGQSINSRPQPQPHVKSGLSMTSPVNGHAQVAPTGSRTVHGVHGTHGALGVSGASSSGLSAASTNDMRDGHGSASRTSMSSTGALATSTSNSSSSPANGGVARSSIPSTTSSTSPLLGGPGVVKPSPSFNASSANKRIPGPTNNAAGSGFGSGSAVAPGQPISTLRNFAPSSVPTPRPPMPQVYLTTSALPTMTTTRQPASTSMTAVTAATNANANANGTSSTTRGTPGKTAPVLFDFRKTDKSPSSSFKSSAAGPLTTTTLSSIPHHGQANTSDSSATATTASSAANTPGPGSRVGPSGVGAMGLGLNGAVNSSSLLSQQFSGPKIGDVPNRVPSTVPLGRRMSSTTSSNGPPIMPRMRPRAMSMQMKIKGELREDGQAYSDVEEDEDDEDDGEIIEGDEIDGTFDYDPDDDDLALDDGDESMGSNADGDASPGPHQPGSKESKLARRKASAAKHHAAKVALMNGKAVQAVGSGSGGIKGRRKGMVFRCESCSKVYRHPSCLSKHRWEHSPHWGTSSKLLLSKHQQVQLLEAAAILVHLDPSNPAGNQPLPEDKSLWPAAVSRTPKTLGLNLDRPSVSPAASGASSAAKTNFTPYTPSSSLPNQTSHLIRKPSPAASSSSTESSERSNGEKDGGNSLAHPQPKRRRPSDVSVRSGLAVQPNAQRGSPLPPRQSMVSPTMTHSSSFSSTATPGSYVNGTYNSVRNGSIGDLRSGFSSFHIGSSYPHPSTPGSPGNIFSKAQYSLTPPSALSQLRSPVFSNLALPESSLRSGTILDAPAEESDEEDEDDPRNRREGSGSSGDATTPAVNADDMDWEAQDMDM